MTTRTVPLAEVLDVLAQVRRHHFDAPGSYVQRALADVERRIQRLASKPPKQARRRCVHWWPEVAPDVWRAACGVNLLSQPLPEASRDIAEATCRACLRKHRGTGAARGGKRGK